MTALSDGLLVRWDADAVVPGAANEGERATAVDVKQGSVKSVNGANLALSRAGTYVTVEDAVVTKSDLNATNGVVHVVDRVLLPPKR